MKNKTAVSLFLAAAFSVQSVPLTAKAEFPTANPDDWYCENLYYDSKGETYAGGASYYGNSSEIVIPEEVWGFPLKWVDAVGMLRYAKGSSFMIYIPDCVEVRNKEDLCWNGRYDDITFVYESGKKEVVSQRFADTNEAPETNVESAWEYRELESFDGVCDTECVELLRYKGIKTNVTVPSEIDGKPVVSIGGKLFEDEGKAIYSPITVNLPDTIKHFAKDCFAGLHDLRIKISGENQYCCYQAYFPDNGEPYLAVTGFGATECVIPEEAAGYPVKGIETDYSTTDRSCRIIHLPDSIKYINNAAFEHMYNLKSINIPKDLKVIPDECFKKCIALETADGIENVRFIADSAFYGASLEDYPTDGLFNLSQNMKRSCDSFYYTDKENCRIYDIVTDPDTFEISAELVYALKDDGDFPETLKGCPVTVNLSDEIPPYTTLFIPEDCKNFCYDMIKFRTDLIDKEDEWVRNASDYSYYALLSHMNNMYISYIPDVKIMSKDLTLADGAFLNFKCQSYEFPGSVSIGSNCNYDSQTLEKLVFSGENSNITLSSAAFDFMDKLKVVSFPKKVSQLNIGQCAFRNAHFTELELPDGEIKIDDYAFSGCAELKELVINGRANISSKAFVSDNALETVTFNKTPVLYPEAFGNCSALSNINTDITKTIDGSAFDNCPSLNMINGETVFNEDGSPKKKYRDFIEKSFNSANNSSIINQYVSYRVKQTVKETVTEDMTDIEKVKALHDKICSMVDYDNEDINAKKNHNDASVFLNETSVCDGYAKALNLMLLEAGVPSCYVCNKDHAWVIVKLGSHYFHIDATWDDGEKTGYSWFLKTDSEIIGDESHKEWDVKVPSPLHSGQINGLYKCSDKMGDVNSDGKVDGIDASAILTAYAQASVEGELDIDPILADYDFSGTINAVDASAVLTYYAKSSVLS